MKRILLIGTGQRSWVYIHALLSQKTAELVAMTDINPMRTEAVSSRIREEFNEKGPEIIPLEELEESIKKYKIDTLIITSMDSTHAEYVVKGMEHNCDVIVEKPMAVNADQCRMISEAQKKYGKKLKVTFNLRYHPATVQLKQKLAQEVIGDLHSFSLEWLLDVSHGADYFRRWHRQKKNSGGLLIHKATHHFDLLHWFCDSTVEQLSALGHRSFYGASNFEKGGSRIAENRFDYQWNPWFEKLYRGPSKVDQYRRDASVFDKDIDIEDDVVINMRLKNGVLGSYHLLAYAPFEGFRFSFNGSKGRLELHIRETWGPGIESSPIQPDGPLAEPGAYLIEHVHWQEPQVHRIDISGKGHGGADQGIISDLFKGSTINDPLNQHAGFEAGLASVLVGDAANRSLEANGKMIILNEIY